MVGAETVTCCQLVYLANALYQRQYIFFNEVKKMKVATGGWFLFYQEQDSEWRTPFSERVEMAPYFLENTAVVLASVIAFVLVWMAMWLYHHYQTAMRESTGTKTTVSESQFFAKIKWLMGQLYQIFIFPFAAGFMIAFMIAVYVDTSGLGRDTGYDSAIPQMVNASLMLIGLLVFAVVFGIEFIDLRGLENGQYGVDHGQKLQGLKEAKPWYIRLFLVRSLLMVVLINVGITVGYQLLVYIVILLQLAYLVLMLIARPYYRTIDNIGVVALEASTLMALSVPLAVTFIDIA
jgi:hypothetical protein